MIKQSKLEIGKYHAIKSYPMFNALLTPTERKIIELILYYQDDNIPFTLSYKEVSDMVGVKTQTVSNNMCKLKRKKYINIRKIKYNC